MDCPRHVAAGCQKPCLVSWCLLVQDLQGATRLRVLWYHTLGLLADFRIYFIPEERDWKGIVPCCCLPFFFRNCPGRGRPSNHARAWRAGPLHHHKPSSSWEDRAWCPSRGSCVLRIPAGNGRCHYTPFCSCVSFVCFLGSDFPVKHSLFLRAFFQFYLTLPIGITHSKKAQYITNTKRNEPKGEGPTGVNLAYWENAIMRPLWLQESGTISECGMALMLTFIPYLCNDSCVD